MFIIGHRGAAGQKPENTIAALRAGQAADVDMLEFDVRLTKDHVPVLLHDPIMWRTHRLPYLISRMNYDELKKRTKSSINPITTLDNALQRFSGQVLLNLELKDRGSAAKILPIVERYITDDDDWQQFLFSSFYISELRRVRKHSKLAQLSLLHWYNDLTFLFAHRSLNLTAVGFHRLHATTFAIAAAKKLELFTYAYTVNRPEAAQRLVDRGIDGIITDYPALLRKSQKDSAD